MLFGAILAGGLNRRFGGAPKGLAPLGRTTVVERVRRALTAAGAIPHLITNTPSAYAEAGMPMRRDSIVDRGAAGGIHAALCWAGELGRTHAVCVACDMPFIDPRLIRHLIERFTAGAAEAVVPSSTGPLGCEPLCAVYATTAADRIAAAVAHGPVSLGSLLSSLRTERLNLAEVRRFGDPDVMFMNVNTRQQLKEAAALLPLLPELEDGV